MSVNIDFIDRLSPDVCLSLASLASQLDLSIEDVIVDIINGCYCPEDGEFYVPFAERVA